MLKGFFRYFAERHLLAYMITFSAILLGLSTLTGIQRDTFPRVEFGEVFISTVYPGASPEDVELKVTNKIEKELQDINGIKHFMSWSRENLSLIRVVIEADERDPDKVVQNVREAVGRVNDLPVEVRESPLVKEIDTSVLPVIEVGMTGDLPYHELRELARRFEKKLENIPGVTSVSRYGYRAREIRVEVLPDKLHTHEVSLRDIVNAIGVRNIRATGGSFESYTSEKNIVTLAQFRDPAEVGDVIVKTTFDGPLVRVKDLAIVHDDFAEEKVLSRMGGVSAISFVAHKRSEADLIRTAEAVKQLVEEQQKIMPKGVTLLLSRDHSTYVKNRLSIVLTNGAIGLVMVLLVLSVFLKPRLAFWVALGVPIAILGVIFLLPMFDTFLDSVTLTAMVLVIGIIVDDAIIISENIYRKFEQGLAPIDAAVEGVHGVFRPVLTTILTTFAAFAPMFFMPGVLGKFVYVIPLVITLALFVSLLESTLALPAHLSAGMQAHAGTQADSARQHYFNTLRDKFRHWLLGVLKRRYISLSVFMVIFIGAMTYAVKFMDFVLFPSSTAERFFIFVKMPTGTSLQATSDAVRKVEQLVAGLGKGELESYVARIGTFGDDVVSNESENFASLQVSLTPFANRERTADAIVESLRKQTDADKTFERVYYQVDTGGPPVGRPIFIRVVGSDDGIRTKLADDVIAYLNSLPGAKDIDRSDKPGKEQVEIKLDYAKLARVGVTVADVAQMVRIAYDGEVVTNVRYGDEDVDFRVIFARGVRGDQAFLSQLQIPNRSGRQTRLGTLAKFDVGPGPSQFSHYQGERAITVSGDIDKKVSTSLKISKAVQAHFQVDRDYPGMQLIIGGEAEESEKSKQDLLNIFIIAALAIYALLILLFNSLWQPLMVMLAIPFAIVGVIIAFALHAQDLGFLALTGIVGLAGVVVNDSLVLVNHVNELRKSSNLTLREVVAQATTDRLRAIVLTTVSTVAGVLPLAYGIGGADPYMSPMALALGYGLLFATPLTLVLVPCLYLIGDDVIVRFRSFRYKKVA
ncbi:MAG: efflux RND transporter permease subunit [Gammaproteobacteria bacterium]|nr:efflux RND transporter permease subunit [Gammaproteobacteria bacterium]MDH5651650.1 efflux RND transporter permease subunit [Gammaproteobacteria bacterium]